MTVASVAPAGRIARCLVLAALLLVPALALATPLDAIWPLAVPAGATWSETFTKSAVGHYGHNGIFLGDGTTYRIWSVGAQGAAGADITSDHKLRLVVTDHGREEGAMLTVLCATDTAPPKLGPGTRFGLTGSLSASLTSAGDVSGLGIIMSATTSGGGGPVQEFMYNFAHESRFADMLPHIDVGTSGSFERNVYADFVAMCGEPPAGSLVVPYFHAVLDGMSAESITATFDDLYFKSPALQVSRAQMDTPRKLGVDVQILNVPTTARGPYKLLLDATINGKVVHVEKALASLPQPPADTIAAAIDLSTAAVPRFTREQQFELKATLEGSNWKDSDSHQVRIALPVVFVHGFAPPGWMQWVAPLGVALQANSLSANLTSQLRRNNSDPDGLWTTGYLRTAQPSGYYQSFAFATYPFSKQSTESAYQYYDRVCGLVLDAPLDNVLSRTYADRANIVAHSNGGLIARFYLNRHRPTALLKVHKLVTVGTPHQGSANTFYATSGWSLAKMKSTLNTQPFAGWLFPQWTALYPATSDTPLTLPTQARNTYTLIAKISDPPPVSIRTYALYGGSWDTPVTAHARVGKATGWVVWMDDQYATRTTALGDDTVPDFSARAWCAKNRKVATTTRHGDLPGDAMIAMTSLAAFADGEPVTDPKVSWSTNTAAAAAPAVGTAPLVATMSAQPGARAVEAVVRLSSAADVTLEVANIAGRPVRMVVSGRQCPAGLTTLLWDRRNDAGLAVPPGMYVLRATARRNDGNQSRAMATVTVTR